MFAKPLSFAAEEAESRLLLILGKPGGGKGTISEKILEVCNSKVCSIMPMTHPRISLHLFGFTCFFSQRDLWFISFSRL
jgi:hypothetical protein